MLDAVILGAGAAGLAAAGELSRRGLRFVVVEAKSRVGGRVLTRHLPGVRVPLELGAEFVHGKAPSLFRVIREHRLKFDEVENRQYRRADDGFKPSDAWAELEKVLRGLRLRGPDRSIDRFLAQAPGEPQTKESARRFLASFHAADPAKLSERSIALLESVAEEREESRSFRVRGGYDRLLGRLWPESDGRIWLDSPVREIRWKRGNVELICAGGRRVSAKACILTLPLGVLKSKPGASGAVRFTPELPAAKRAAMSRLEMGPARRFVFKFRGAPWQSELGLRGPAFFHTPELPIKVWWTSMHPRSGVFTGWAGGPYAESLGSDPQRAAGKAIFELLGDVDLEGVHFHDWLTDPFARGAYSYAAVGGFAAFGELAKPIDATLFFAGEATDSNGQHATVEGAVASGWRAARELSKA